LLLLVVVREVELPSQKLVVPLMEAVGGVQEFTARTEEVPKQEVLGSTILTT
jgi:hypothetical protein